MPAVKINTKVQITVPEYPGKVYTGVVEASARAVDAQSGTTRMQLVVDNSAGELMPGAFANTRIELPRNLQALSIPAGALIFDQKGLRVATVDANNKVVLKPITIAPRSWPGRRDRHRHRARPTASSTARPTGWLTAIRCGSIDTKVDAKKAAPRARPRKEPRPRAADGVRSGHGPLLISGVRRAACGCRDEWVADFRCRVTLFGPVES